MISAMNYDFIYNYIFLPSRFNLKFLYKRKDQELIGQLIGIFPRTM